MHKPTTPDRPTRWQRHPHVRDVLQWTAFVMLCGISIPMLLIIGQRISLLYDAYQEEHGWNLLLQAPLGSPMIVSAFDGKPDCEAWRERTIMNAFTQGQLIPALVCEPRLSHLARIQYAIRELPMRARYVEDEFKKVRIIGPTTETSPP
jgi:hypothetical protein